MQSNIFVVTQYSPQTERVKILGIYKSIKTAKLHMGDKIQIHGPFVIDMNKNNGNLNIG